MRALSEVRASLSLDPDAGLSSSAAADSRKRFGENRLTPLPREPLWRKFLEKFDESIIKILLAAALLSMFVELFRGDPEHAPPVPGNPMLAAVALAVVALAVIALFVLRQTQWLPSLMFVSAIVVFFLGLFVGHPSIEGLAVMVAVILATGVAFLSEAKSDREFEALNAQKDSVQVKVTRDGKFHVLKLEEVVVGDVIDLETGDEIPADGRLFRAVDLSINQSLMTGESDAVKKHAVADATDDGPDKPGCLYRGTQVVDGAGVMIVTEVGDETMLGQIARRLSGDDEEPDAQGQQVKDKLTISKAPTPLQEKLTNLADLISKVGYIAALLIFIALLARGFVVGEMNPYVDGEITRDGVLKVAGYLLNYFVYVVIIIVVAVPEGLPMSVTVSLALAMQKMTKANALVRQLVACETIGSATVICSDKTGTLTQNKMQVVRLFVGGSGAEREQPGWLAPETYAKTASDSKPLDWIALNAAANSTANLEEKDGKTVTVGSSTEGALLYWLREGKLDHVKVRAEYEPLYKLTFNSERKRMTSVVRHGGLVALMKGAPEIVLEHTTHYLAADGSVRPWDDAAKAAVLAYQRDSARKSMRTLAFAHRQLPADYPTSDEELQKKQEEIERGLVFDGMVAIRDPLRDDVKQAVDRCKAAGIEVKMITGDNVETARAIAYDVGLVDSLDTAIDTDDAIVLTSTKFNADYNQWKALAGQLTPEGTAQRDAIMNRLTGLRVLARARPLDKYKMVELLQERQQVVAMTGDGTNDAVSLKKADVGLAMGIAGTEVAKEASKIVLLDDAFSTIVKAVQWGRSLYENIQRFIQFQLTINVSALTIAFLGPFFGVRPPFTVLQLLWINVIMDTFASIALCSEPPREGVMKLPPKRKDENILTPQMKRTILGTAAFFVVVMLGLLLGMKYGHWFSYRAGFSPVTAIESDTSLKEWQGTKEAFEEIDADGDGVITPKEAHEFKAKKVSSEFDPLTTRQVSIFFAIYVFFQVWNQINCRSLTPQMSGLRVWENPTFLMIAGTTAVVQVVITSVPFIAEIFKVERLGVIDWVCIILGTASVLLFGEAWRLVRLRAAK